MKARFYEIARKASGRAVNDIGKMQKAAAYVGAWVMANIDEEKFNYEITMASQMEELTELNLLKATMEIKKDALETGGFSHDHGPALTVAANALIDVCGWDDEDITDWFGALVMNDDGENLGADVGFEEE